MKTKRKTITTLFIGILLGIALVFGVAYAWYYFVIKPTRPSAEMLEVVESVAPEGASVAYGDDSEEYDEEEDYYHETYLENGEYHYYPTAIGPTIERTIYEVSNLQELLDALGSNRTIYITQDINITEQVAHIAPLNQYQIAHCGESEVYKNLDNCMYLAYEQEHYTLRTLGHKIHLIENMDQSAFVEERITGAFSTLMASDIFLTIHSTKNLNIIGNKNNIIIENSESGVLHFAENENLAISQMHIYHDLPVAEECGNFAPVVSFEWCHNVLIDECQLNGSGTVGVYATESDFVEIKNTKIYNCTSEAFDFSYVENSLIENCKIVDNQLYNILATCYSNVHFKDCRIQNNELYNYIIYFSCDEYHDENNIHFENCIVQESDYENLSAVDYGNVTGLASSIENQYNDENVNKNLPADIAEKFQGIWLNTEFEALLKEIFSLVTAKNIQLPISMHCTQERFYYFEDGAFHFLHWEDNKLMYEDDTELGRLKKIDENTIQLLNDDDVIIATYRKIKNEAGEDAKDFATGLNKLVASVLAGRYKLKVENGKSERFTLKADANIADSKDYSEMRMMLFQETQNLWRNVVVFYKKDKTVQCYIVLKKENDVLKLQKIDIVTPSKFNRENEFAELKRLEK